MHCTSPCLAASERAGVHHCRKVSSWTAGVVDACLIPEVPFALKGTKGLFAYIEKVLEERGHCVMCIAEGAGQVSLERT